MTLKEKIVLGAAMLICSTPAWAAAVAPGPETDIGISAAVIMGVAYLRMRRKAKRTRD